MGFLNYLDNYEEKLQRVEKPVVKKVIVKQPVKKVTEAKVVQKPKPAFQIQPKKIIKNPIVEAHKRAVDILDGLPETTITENVIQTQENTPNVNQQIPPSQIFKSVKSHASALL
jgi:hypothetical protein